MTVQEKNARGTNNVTDLNEVRQAKAKAQQEKASSKAVKADSSQKAEDPHGNRRFDAAKVARIKASIAAGEYQIDPSRIADKFIEHDRNQ